MKCPRCKSNKQELIFALAELFDEIEMTPEEVRESLREAGYDPDEVGKAIAAVAQKAMEAQQATGEGKDEPKQAIKTT